MKTSLTNICLADIAPSKTNPREKFNGATYDSLRESVRQSGVLSPIMVRPVEGEKPYEIVFGERRFRVSCELAKENGGIKEHEIPAIVRTMTDAEAFEAQTVENLQREDLTPLEEARGYAAYLKDKGNDALVDLAMKVGTSFHRIRRLMAVLGLPAEILADWDSGKVAFGHLEQLIRMETPEKQVDVYTKFMNGWNEKTVVNLRRTIDNMTVNLDSALFDQTQCATCPKSAGCQKDLFGEEISEKAGCSDQQCFIEKQRTHITDNWATISEEQKIKTKRFQFDHEVPYSERKVMTKLPKQCKECDSALVLVYALTGKLAAQYPVCAGDKKCYTNIHEAPTTTAFASGVEASGEEKDTPRVNWHGECFREMFYKDAIPERLASISPTDVTTLRLALLALALENPMIRRHIEPDPCKYNTTDLMPAIVEMEIDQLYKILHDSVLSTIMNRDSGGSNMPGMRHQVAQHLGISLESDFRLTKPYLMKKTSQELRKMIADFNFFADEKFAACLQAMGKNPENVHMAKKAQIVHAMLQADLAGKVPDEILVFEVNTDSQYHKYKKLFETPAEAESAEGEESTGSEA